MYYATRFNNSPELTDFMSQTVSAIRSEMPDSAKQFADMILTGILSKFNDLTSVSSLDKLNASLTEFNAELSKYCAQSVKLTSIDVTNYRTVGVDANSKQSIVKLSDVTTNVYEVCFTADKRSERVLPTIDNIVSALSSVQNIDASMLDSIAAYIVKRHEGTDDVMKLYAVAYNVLGKDNKPITKLSFATADSLQSLAARLAPKCNSAGALRTLLRTLDSSLNEVTDPILIS